MKIYEIRDITDEETYHTAMYCETVEKAIAELKRLGQEVCDSFEDNEYVRGAVFEHEVGACNFMKTFNVRMFEMEFTRKFSDEEEKSGWEHKVIYERN